MQYEHGDKLYVVTSRHLSPGQQATQSAHALSLFHFDQSEVSAAWHRDSRFLCLLSVKNQQALELLQKVLENQGIRHAAWHEPDWDHVLTGIAIEPGDATCKLLSALPLALKECTRKEVHTV